jgi:hypothetical protein
MQSATYVNVLPLILAHMRGSPLLRALQRRDVGAPAWYAAVAVGEGASGRGGLSAPPAPRPPRVGAAQGGREGEPGPGGRGGLPGLGRPPAARRGPSAPRGHGGGRGERSALPAGRGGSGRRAAARSSPPHRSAGQSGAVGAALSARDVAGRPRRGSDAAPGGARAPLWRLGAHTQSRPLPRPGQPRGGAGLVLAASLSPPGTCDVTDAGRSAILRVPRRAA